MSGIYGFLSERAIEQHKEYLQTLKYRYSVCRKTYPEISDKGMGEIQRLRMKEREMEEILRLKCDIVFHECFFNSFSAPYIKSKRVAAEFGSEASFLYEIYMCANRVSRGFVAVADNGKGLCIFNTEEAYHKICRARLYEPILAIDMEEHAYFSDYGFNKEEYLKRALSALNLGAL